MTKSTWQWILSLSLSLPLPLSSSLFLYLLLFLHLSPFLSLSLPLSLSFFFFKKLIIDLILTPELSDLFVFPNPLNFYSSYSQGQILVCPYTIREFGKCPVFYAGDYLFPPIRA